MADWAIEFLRFLILDGALLVGLFLLITWIVVLLQQRMPMQSTQSRLMAGSGWRSAFLASVGGVVTPFCSCSTIPVLSGMLRAGVGFAPSFAFLVASPVVNEGVFILLLSTKGPMPAFAFLAAGLVLTSSAGVLAQRLGLARHVNAAVAKPAAGVFVGSSAPVWPGWRPAGRFAWLAALQELSRAGPYLIVGLLVGGLIYGLVPKETLVALLHGIPAWQLYVVCALVGVPLYVSPMAALPIGLALIEKGLPIGPLVTLLVSAIGTSLPEIVLLLRLFKLPLVVAHTITVVVCALALGCFVSLVV